MTTIFLFVIYLLGAFITLVVCNLINPQYDDTDRFVCSFLWFIVIPILLIGFLILHFIGGFFELANITTKKIKDWYDN